MKHFLSLAIFIIICSDIVHSESSVFGLAPNSFGMVNMSSSTAAAGRGGFEIAYFDSLSLNNKNFAQWPFLTQTTINLNAGYNYLSTEIPSQSTSSSTGNFDGGFLAIPVIHNTLALGVGITPVLKSDQSLSAVQNSGDAEAVETLESSGNLSQGSIGLSYAMTENLSVAGIISYNFGMVEDMLRINYESLGYSNILISNQYKMYGSSFALHSFYTINSNLFSGLSLNFPSKLKLRTEQTSVNSNTFVEEEREISFPLKMTFGMAYLFENRYIAGFDFNYQSWKSGYKIDDVKPAGFDNSYRLSAGIEKMPGGRRFVPYGQKMYYRAGLYLGKLNLLYNNKNVMEYGVSLGLGFPVLNHKNRIDVALQYGKKGSISENQATENIITFKISITAGNLWFVREDN